MLAYLPCVTEAGIVIDQNVLIEDFFPTILELAGVDRYDVRQQVDGISFVPLLKNKAMSDSSRTLLWHFPSNWGQGVGTLRQHYKGMTVEEMGMGPATAVRKGDWKLIYFYGTGKAELYHLGNDISEQHNLINTHPDKARTLMAAMLSELNEKRAQFPLSRPKEHRVGKKCVSTCRSRG